MDVKQVVSFEVEKDEKVYCYSLPLDGTYGAAIDALFEILEEVRKMQNQAIERAQASCQPSPSAPAEVEAEIIEGE